jgi:hypothetical protein
MFYAPAFGFVRSAIAGAASVNGILDVAHVPVESAPRADAASVTCILDLAHVPVESAPRADAASVTCILDLAYVQVGFWAWQNDVRQPYILKQMVS